MDKMKSCQNQQEYWRDKITNITGEMLMLSAEGNEEEFKKQFDDLTTAYTILWRFDRKRDGLDENSIKNKIDLSESAML